MAPPPAVTILGIRHHGPGSARSVRLALDLLEPAAVIIEGPPELDTVAPLAAEADMAPPVAGLVYDVAEPRRASFYPMAVFSPEWVALRWALEREVPVRFADLPATNRLALDRQRAEQPSPEQPPVEEPALEPAGSGTVDDDAAEEAQTADNPTADERIGEEHAEAEQADDDQVGPGLTALQLADPIAALAAAAGYEDAERWWEDAIEQRAAGDDVLGRFLAVTEAMGEFRAAVEEAELADESLNEEREASMRKILRATVKETEGPVAFVCGAFHAPMLDPDRWPSVSADNATLKGLPKVKVAATWAPWTSGRLAYASGYGAGVDAPGWYHHLFTTASDVIARWMIRVAGLLREDGHDASAASVVEATRLADTLASLRGRPLPGLAEVSDAAETVFGGGSNLALQAIGNRLLVGDELGAVPAATPMVPLAEDLARRQRSLRLKPSAERKTVTVDLRKDSQLERSVLFRRLHLLGIEWATEVGAGRSGGTFKEAWEVEWKPELAVAVIEASLYGTTVASAAAARVLTAAEEAPDLETLAVLVERCLPADLPDALAGVLDVLSARTAVQPDHLALMATVEPLARTRRYGNVRGVDTEIVHDVLTVMVTRAAIGLASACATLDDDAAGQMRLAIESVERGVALVDDPELLSRWRDALGALSPTNVHGSVIGRTTRILLDAGRLDSGEAGRRLQRALSPSADTTRAASWLDGFLAGDVALLLYDQELFTVIDDWLSGLDRERFDDLLPLVRRTFSRFEKAERRQIGELLNRGQGAATVPRSDEVDRERAAAAVAKVSDLLGLGGGR